MSELVDSGAETLRRLAADIQVADARLTAQGSPFEVGVEDVLGVAMHVFTQRRRCIGEFLDASLQFADKEFLVFDGGRRITFGQHHRLVDGVSAALAESYGVVKGDRVAVCGANSLGWVLIAMACARLGAVVVAFNSWWSQDELSAAVTLSEPKVLVADERRREALKPITSHRPLLAMETVDTVLASHAPRHRDIEVGEDDPWVLAFTSGTSGRPKAATLTHRCLIGFVQLNAYIGARSALLSGRTGAAAQPETVRLAVFPLFHISGLSSLVSTLAFGIKTVWPMGRFDAGRVIELTRDERITMWGGASTHLVRLVDHPALADIDTTQLTSVGIGGSASTPGLIARTEAALPHLGGTFSSGYGMTECGGLASHASNELLRAAADCVGTPFPTCDVKIIDEEGHELPDGKVGSICIRSPILMTEYWRNPAANAGAMLPGRWLRTEDYGRLEHGLLFIASRVRDLIIRGGENVYPIEVENCLDQVDDVIESAVYGRDDDEFGQVVVATVVVRPGSTVTAEQLQQHCAATLAYYKVPVTIDVRTTPLPRNASGKVLKALIADRREDLTPVEPD